MKLFADLLKRFVMQAYQGRAVGAKGERIVWLPLKPLSDVLGYTENTIKAFLDGKRLLPPQALRTLLVKVLVRKKVLTGFDPTWEWVRVLGSVEHLRVVWEVFDPPPFVQQAPRPPAWAVERGEEEQAWAALVAGEGPVAIWGVEGVGKTTLVKRLAHRPEVRYFFPDGVLWVELGEGWNEKDWLDVWARVLGVREEDPARRQAAVARRITEGRYLVIVDGVESGEVVAPLLRGGRHMGLLVTCPAARVAYEIGGLAVHLGEMAEEEALRLLHRTIDRPKYRREEACRLARVVGRYAQALTIAAYLVNQSDLPSVLEDVAGEQRGVGTLAVEPSDGGEEKGSQQASVRAVMNATYRRLDPETQRAVRALAIVASRVPYVDGPLMAALMGRRGDVTKGRAVLRTLAGYGIVEPVDVEDLQQRWGVLRLADEPEEEPVYRVPPLWLRFAAEQLQEQGPEKWRFIWRYNWYGGDLEARPFRCMVKRPPRIRKQSRPPFGWSLPFKKIKETARRAQLHGLLLDPRIRHLVQRVQQIPSEGSISMLSGPALVLCLGGLIVTLMALGVASIVLWVLLFAMVGGLLLVTLLTVVAFGLRSLEAYRVLQWLNDVLLPLAMLDPQEREEKLRTWGLEEGKIWQAMVKE
jgi:hypothetical protein